MVGYDDDDNEKTPEAKKSEGTVIGQMKDQYQADLDDNMDWIERAKTSYQFYTGIKQWDEAVLEILRKEGRPALTLNRVFPIINMLCGYQRQNRTDVKLYPRRNGSIPVASLGTELLKHTMDCCDGEYEKSDMFADGVIGGKGFAGLEKEYLTDIVNGDLVFKKKSPFSVLPDQGNRNYDINRGNHVFDCYWWTKKEVELAYKDKAKDLTEAVASPEHTFERYNPVAEDYATDPDVFGSFEDSRLKTRYFIKTRWMKVWEMVTFLVHLPTLTPRIIEKKERKQVDILAATGALAEYKLVERAAPILYETVTVGDMVLEHTRNPLGGIHLFPIFRFCPYWVDGYVMGVIDNLIDPQKEHNKSRSQVLHHLNASANSMMKVKDGSDENAMKELERKRSKPGYVADMKKFGGGMDAIEQEPPAKLDTGHLTTAAQSAEDIKDISGVNDNLAGTDKAKESGRSRLIQQQAGLTVSEIIFDNFARTEKSIATFTWEVIRRSNVYSEAEIMSIVQEHNLKHFVTEDGGIDLSPMKNWNLGVYGVKVDKGANLPTIRMANFEQMLDAMKAGVQIPPHILAELSDWPNKDEIVGFLKQMAGIPLQGDKGGQGAGRRPSREIAGGQKTY